MKNSSENFNTPEKFPIWKTITLGGGTKNQLIEEMVEGGVQISSFAEEVINNPVFSVSKEFKKIDLVKVTHEDLGCSINSSVRSIYEKAKELNLELCPAEVGPRLALQLKDLPEDEEMYIAMENIADSDGNDTGVFSIGSNARGDTFLGIEYNSGPGDAREDGSYLIFAKKK